MFAGKENTSMQNYFCVVKIGRSRADGSRTNNGGTGYGLHWFSARCFRKCRDAAFADRYARLFIKRRKLARTCQLPGAAVHGPATISPEKHDGIFRDNCGVCSAGSALLGVQPASEYKMLVVSHGCTSRCGIVRLLQQSAYPPLINFQHLAFVIAFILHNGKDTPTIA